MRLNKRGFSLVEILISLLILGIGLIISFNLLPLSWQYLAYSRKLNEVSILAEKKLEELKSEDNLSASPMSGKEKDLDWNLTAQPIKLEGDLELIQVELNIEFYFQGSPQKQKFVTYLY